MLRSSTHDLEPLAALTVACNVIEVNGFFLELIALYRDISTGASVRLGASFETDKFEIAFGRLNDWSFSSALGKPASPEEKDLGQIAEACNRTALELRYELNKIATQTKPHESGHKREALKRAFQTMWNSKTIDKLHERFQSQKSALDTGLLVHIA